MDTRFSDMPLVDCKPKFSSCCRLRNSSVRTRKKAREFRSYHDGSLISRTRMCTPWRSGTPRARALEFEIGKEMSVRDPVCVK